MSDAHGATRSTAAPELSISRRGLWPGVWRIADPKFALASVASMLLGASAAAHEGPIAWGRLALTVLVLGLVSLGLTFLYHAPPVKLSHRGLGEAAVALTCGPLVACGTYLVQRNDLPLAMVLLSVPLGLAIASFVLLDELQGDEADRDAGRKTLAVRLGRAHAARVFTLTIGASYVVLAILPLLGLPSGVWLGLAGLPLAGLAAQRMMSAPLTAPQIASAQEWTLFSFLLMAADAAVGLLVFAR